MKRKLYKGRHWIAKGGYHFIQRTRDFETVLVGEVREKLCQKLSEITSLFIQPTNKFVGLSTM